MRFLVRITSAKLLVLVAAATLFAPGQFVHKAAGA